MSRLSRAACLLLAGVLAACDSGSDSDRPGPATEVEVVSGSDQEAAAGAALPQQVVVKVVDEDGRGVPDVPVNFAVTSGGGSFFAPVVNTSRDGTATNSWTLGNGAGQQTAEARVSVDGTMLAG